MTLWDIGIRACDSAVTVWAVWRIGIRGCDSAVTVWRIGIRGCDSAVTVWDIGSVLVSVGNLHGRSIS